jgi:BioD-like phosphotransacetylase family protein
MDKLIIGSMCQSTGKTSLIVGLAKTLKKKIGYAKPLGDRMLYRKKRLWDYDSTLITNIFGLEEIPDDISIGFDHSKLRYMYDEKSLREKLESVLNDVSKGKDIVFIEGAREINYGMSVFLDTLSIAAYTGGKLILVASGNDNAILDDLAFLKKRIDLTGVRLGGVVLNKIANLDEFKDTSLPGIQEAGIKVLGLIPFEKALTTFNVGYLAERLFAKVVTGEEMLQKTVSHVFIGTMHVHAALENPLFKEKGKAVITGGDRTDMILAALEGDTACVVLTDNISPSAKIVAAAKEREIPLLLVPADTFQIARQMDAMEPLLTKDDVAKITLLENLVRTHVDVDEITRG